MAFEKQQPLDEKDIHWGCLNCTSAAKVAPMDMWIAVGFGSAYLSKNGEVIWDEQMAETDDDIWTVKKAEDLAKQDPDNDWRIVKYSPLHGETFQRQGDSNWVCIESNPGFA